MTVPTRGALCVLRFLSVVDQAPEQKAKPMPIFALIDSLEPCWKDRTCLAALTAGLSGIVSMGRRWDVIGRVKRTNTSDRIRYVATGGAIGSVISGVLAIMGFRAMPNHLEYVCGVVVILALVVDWGSDSGIEILRRFVKWLATRVGMGDLFKAESSPVNTGSQATGGPTKGGTSSER